MNQMDEVGRRLEGQIVNGEFLLKRYLGASDHSIVFLTELAGNEPRRAAIKLIPIAPQTSELQLSLLKAAAKLSHPNLLHLFQAGQCQLGETKLIYAVTEYAEENLSQVLPARALTPAETRDLLVSIVDVLSYLHGRGLVHTRLKPRNIMATKDQLKLSTDGISEQSESSQEFGRQSVYDAPEIGRGIISPAADVWSLGVTLVEALTQHVPTWNRTGQGEPVVPETLPNPFLDIALHSLRRNPQQRWTVADIAARLNKTDLPSVPIQVSAVSPQPSTKSRFTSQIVAVGIAFIVVLGSWSLFRYRREARQHVVTLQQPNATQPKPAPGTPSQAGRSNQTSRNSKNSTASSSRTPATTPEMTLEKSTAPKAAASGPAPGQILQQVLPDVSKSARNTIQGTVKVSVWVTVDPSGNVARATFQSAGPSKYFARKAMEAAQRWKFAPPEGRQAPSTWILRFQFRRSGTTVVPLQATP